MAGIVAHNYAEALFSIANEEKQLDAYMDQINLVLNAFDQEPEFMKLMAHPKMDKIQKKEMLMAVFGKALDSTILNFMKLLVDKSRFSHFHEIGLVFHDLYNEAKGIEVALVTTAKPLSKEESQKLTKVLEDKIHKTVELAIVVDEDLMAGIRVKIGDQVIDNTASTRLANLKEMVVRSEYTSERGERE